MSKDEEKLAALGYTQELRRGWGLINNFGISFSIISVITGISTLFQFGLTTGGPAVMVVGWIVVSFFTMFVALGMAEITSAIPCAGGPYYWSAILAPKKSSAFWSWMTGWFNFLGQVAVTCGITFGLAGLISVTASIDGTYEPTAGKTVAIYLGLIVSHGLVNTFGVRILPYLNNVSIALHSLGIFSFAVGIVAKAPTHQSAKFVFTTFVDFTGVSYTDADPIGWAQRASPAYVSIVGILMAQYTITGFDASAHMSEETINAETAAPLGVLTSVGVSSIFGFFLLLCLLFSIQDFDTTVNSEIGQPVVQILIDIFGRSGAKAMMALLIITVWHCGLFSLTSNSRMMYAFARDGAISPFFSHVSTKYEVPVRTIWLAAFLAFLLSLPSLGSSVAFAAATSIATIGLYISYIIPIALAVFYHDKFERGPFNLGRYSRVIGTIASLWVLFISVVFCLPAVNPVNTQTLNYTPVAVGIILAGALISWFAFARKTFTGPLQTIALESPEVLRRQGIEADKLRLEKAGTGTVKVQRVASNEE
ncbi:APA family basic amino acid/polyamine antiporter [Mrakia frigida]|uniref:APA family basic amino acid/polyamine antiporter n=1 Tax=Mrakia frigida TaxID=29902 RepID=UPI003FCBFC17